MRGKSAICVAVLALLVIPRLATAQQKVYAGEVMSVDRVQGTLIIADLDAGRGGDPKRSSTNVTVATDGQTRVVVAGPGPGGWFGEDVKSLASLADVRPGDLVSVELRSEGGPPPTAKLIRVLGKE
jgi:hypothetical protein